MKENKTFSLGGSSTGTQGMEREVNERRRGSKRTEKKRQERQHIKKNQPDFKATRCRIMGDGMLTRLRTWWKKMRPSSSTVPLSSKYEDRNHKTIGEEDTRQVTEKDEIPDEAPEEGFTSKLDNGGEFANSSSVREDFADDHITEGNSNHTIREKSLSRTQGLNTMRKIIR